jgi:hypothetical protein
MKKALAGLALGALLSSPVFAASSIDTAALRIAYVNGPAPEVWRISLVGQTESSYSFSIDTLNRYLSASTRDPAGAGASYETTFWSQLRINMNPRYRMTGLTLSGVAEGELAAGQLPGVPAGVVHNAASFFWGTASDGYNQPFSDFQGEHSLDSGAFGLDLDGADVGLFGSVSAQAWGVEGGGASAASVARASIHDLVLHVHVAVIPEPHSWAMLLGGLGLLGMAEACARRLS